MEGNVLCKAKALEEVYLSLHPHRIDLPGIAESLLQAGDAFYCNRWLDDVKPGKGGDHVLNCAYLLTGSSPFAIDLGFACLKARLDEGVVPLEIHVLDKLNATTLTYVDLVLLIAEQLLEFAEGLGISFDVVPEEVMPHEDIATAFFARRLLGLERNGEGICPAEEVGLLQSLRDTRLTAKYSTPLHQMLLYTLEPKITELIGFCNHVIATVQVALELAGLGPLWILFPDLYRLEVERVRGLLYPHAPILSTFACCTCFSVPGALYYHPHFRRIGPFFARHWEVPAVQLEPIEGWCDGAGMGVLRSIVADRMELGLFESVEILDELILASGGCLMDLLRLVVIAADNACNHDRIAITPADGQWAMGSLLKTYGTRLSTPSNTTDEQDIQKMQRSRYEVLSAIEADEAGYEMLEGPVGLALRHQDCILKVGQGTYCVHPMVARVMAAQGVVLRSVVTQGH